MKKRIGFVSNSSSSSFIITMKKNKELTSKTIMDILDPGKDSFFYNMAKEMSEMLVRGIDEMTIDYIYNDWCYPREDNLTEEEKLQKLIDDGNSPYVEETLRKISEGKIKMYQGSVSDDDGGLEAAICDMEINFENDDIKFEKDGGY